MTVHTVCWLKLAVRELLFEITCMCLLLWTCQQSLKDLSLLVSADLTIIIIQYIIKSILLPSFALNVCIRKVILNIF